MLFRIFDPLALVRLQDNEVKVNGRDKFTMAEQFAGIRDAIWQEVKNGQNVNSYRREVQRMHVYVLDQIVNKSPVFFPHDAVALARYDLGVIRNWIEQAMTNNNLDVYTKAHLQEMQAKIDALLNARMQRFY